MWKARLLMTTVLVFICTDAFAARDDIFAAFRQHNLERARKLIEQDSRLIFTVDDYGKTPLHWAVMRGSEDMVMCLVKQGAAVNAEDANGWTPIHYACGYSQLTNVRYLLEHKAVLKPDDSGITPLWSAALSIGSSYDPKTRSFIQTPVLEVVELLIRHGQDPNQPWIDQKGDEHFLISSVARSGRNIPVLKRLIELGADLDIQDKKGLTPVHQVIAYADERVYRTEDRVMGLKTLIEAGADLNLPDVDGWTPLHSAVHFNQPAMVRILLEHGVKADAKTPGKQTPLDFARRQKFRDIEKILLEHQNR